MTRKEALTELLEKVKAGEYTASGDSDDMWLKWHDAFSPRDWKSYNELAHGAFDGSMDAALSLFEAVLPGWLYFGGPCVASEGSLYTVYSADMEQCECGRAYTPSRALLIAILEALVAMEEG